MVRTINVATMSPHDGVFIRGSGAGGRAGWSVAGGGDFNGDGIPDVFVGVPLRNPNVYVVYGKAGFSGIDLATLTVADGFTIIGNGDGEGTALASVGFTGTGFDSILIGAQFAGQNPVSPYQPGAGAAYLVYGQIGSSLHVDQIRFQAGPPLEPYYGRAHDGDRIYDLHFGQAVGGGGDVNGDGLNDYIIGAPQGSRGGGDSGQSYVVFGDDPYAPGGGGGFIIVGDSSGDDSGPAVGDAGDFNGDGYDDLIVGSPDNDRAGSQAGAAYLIYGRGTPFPSTIDLTTLAQPDGFAIFGVGPGNRAGRHLAGAGDVNGDGYDDVLIYSGGGGRIWLIFGREERPASIHLNALGPADGFEILGGSNAIAGAGDVNDDGYDDILIGAGGRAYLLYGKGQGFGTVDLGALADGAGFIVQGTAGDGLGASVASAGDFNMDGYPDIIVGAPYDDHGATDAGAAYVIFGGPTPHAWNVIAGNDAGESLTGTAGDDLITGGAGGDHLYGLARNDKLSPGAGDDVVYGDAGRDAIDYRSAAGAIYADLGARTVYETDVTTGTVAAPLAPLSVDLVFEVEDLIGSGFGDRLYGSAGDNRIWPGAGDDIAYGMGGTDQVGYLDGAGAVFLDLAARTVYETGWTTGTVEGGAGLSLISTDYVIGFSDVVGTAFGDRLEGDAASNVFDGEGGDDIIYGLDGADTLSGGDGGDILVGGDGDDVISGASGGDTLVGGAGNDAFSWAESGQGNDYVTDFTPGEDVLRFHAASFGYAPGAAAVLVSDSAPTAAAANSFLYDTDTGLLSFDADGAGPGGPVAIVQLKDAPPIAALDIILYG